MPTYDVKLKKMLIGIKKRKSIWLLEITTKTCFIKRCLNNSMLT